MPWILALVAGTGCGRGGETTGVTSASLPSAPQEVRAHVRFEFVPVEAGRMPRAVAVWTGEESRRIGPLQQWRGSLPVAADAGPLWVDPQDGASTFHPLRVASPSGRLLRLPLVPRVRLVGTMYVELTDLLQEFVAPFEGSRIRRWNHRPLTVALPADRAWPVDYAEACVQAIDAWNHALDDIWLVAVDPGATADVRCEIAESDRLAFTQLLSTDAEGHPTAMRVQLSPRWSAGSERYVRRVYLHELGHALGLWGHSRDLEHVLNGRAVIRDELHPYEIRAMQWLWSLPNDFDLVVLRRPPRIGPGPGPSPVTRCGAAMERGTAVIRPR